jgi:hypothetical protein
MTDQKATDQKAYEASKEWAARYAPEMTERELNCMAIGFVHGWTAAEQAACTAEAGKGAHQ